MKPIIGIPGRVLKKRNGTKPKNLDIIDKYGGVPLIITHIDQRILNLCDGFLLTGGYSWNEVDHGILLHAKRLDKPCLGICLGMQAMVDNALEDTTVPNNSYLEHFQSNKKYAHQVMVNLDSKLGKIIKQEYVNVNSRHHTHINETNEIRINAIADDGIPEGVELPSFRFMIGVQWHPEDLDDEVSGRLFKAFINACKNK